jgi:hypothetical protein
MISLSIPLGAINVSVVLERRYGGAIVMAGPSSDLGSPGAQ